MQSFGYSFCKGRALAAQREYQRKYFNKRQHGRRIFSALHRQMKKMDLFENCSVKKDLQKKFGGRICW